MKDALMSKLSCWDHTVAQRLALREVLRQLTLPQWDHPSLCPGWRVRDVAGHVISAPQLDWAATAKVLPGLRHGYNGMILRDGRRRGDRTIASILAEFDQWADVRKGPVTVTHLEPLVDILVHTQDIVRPLGIEHHMPADAAAVAADRCRLLRLLLGSADVVRGVRMIATDIDWSRGRADRPVVEGPMEELLMLCAGRPAHDERLSGPGAALTPRSAA